MNYEKSSNCLDRRMKIIIHEKRSAECGLQETDMKKRLLFGFIMVGGTILIILTSSSG